MASRPALLRNLGLKTSRSGSASWSGSCFRPGRRERISERSYRIALSVVNIPSRTIIASPLPPAWTSASAEPLPRSARWIRQARSCRRPPGRRQAERRFPPSPEDINIPPEIEVISISPGELRIVLDAVAEGSSRSSRTSRARPLGVRRCPISTVEPTLRARPGALDLALANEDDHDRSRLARGPRRELFRPRDGARRFAGRPRAGGADRDGRRAPAPRRDCSAGSDADPDRGGEALGVRR